MEHLSEPAVSVVIPVYNLESYVACCLDSVRRQTFAGFEAIVVDDGSTDGSWDIVRRYADADARIVAVHTQNQGVARARETALSRVRGRYVCFLDSDDWWEPDMLERMVAAIEEGEGYDVVCCGFTRVASTYRTSMPERLSGATMNRDAFLQNIVAHRVMPSLCSKIYRRTLFVDSLHHYVMPMGQDLLLNLQIACGASRVRVIDYVGYNYLQRAGSSIHTNRLTFDYCRRFAECVADIFSRNAGILDPQQAEFLQIVSDLWWYVGYVSKSRNRWVGREEFARRLHEKAPRHWRALRSIFSRRQLLLFRLDRRRALRPLVVVLSTVYRWGESIERRLTR
ncbi:MAG: glycosyltransferase [Alistipes sp.]|nr:glycosyltransferase [Alistipes sp.]